jgi:hypothetical protein
MAKAKVAQVSAHRTKTKKRRAGVHAKSKASRSKHSKNYLKKNVGQG